MVVLSHLIGPREFGLFAIASAPIMLICTITLLGLTPAIVRSEGDGNAVAGNALTIALAMSAAGTLTAAAIAWWVHSIGGESARLAQLMIVGLPVIVLTTISGVAKGLMQRQQQFATMAKVHIASNLANAVVAITAALMGAGAFALALGYLTMELVYTVGAYRMVRIKPAFVWSETAGILRFSIGYVTLTLIETASLALSRLLLATVSGPVAVGFFQRGTAVRNIALQLSVTPMDTFIYARISEVFSRPEALQREYDRASVIALMFSAPLSIGILTAAEQWTPILFGAAWEPAGLLIAIAVAVMPLRALERANAVVARAAGKHNFRVVQMLLTLLFSLFMIYALADISLAAAMAGVSVVLAVSFLPGLWNATRIMGTSIRGQLRKIIPGLVLWFVFSLLALAAKYFFFSVGITGWLAALLAAGLGAAGFVLISAVFPHHIYAGEPAKLIADYRHSFFSLAFGERRQTSLPHRQGAKHD